MGTGKIAKAAILGQQGGVWATSAGFNVRLFPLLIMVHRVDIVPQLGADEQSAILAALSNSEGALASGLRLEKQKYFVFRADGRSIYGKKAVSRIPVRVIPTSQTPRLGRWSYHRQDQASRPCRHLPTPSAGRRIDSCRRGPRGLLDQCRLLDVFSGWTVVVNQSKAKLYYCWLRTRAVHK